MKISLQANQVVLTLPVEIHKAGFRKYRGLWTTLFGSARCHATILSGVDFSATEGDRIGVMGLNGAGKTTLLRVLNGAYAPTSGSIRSEGVCQSLLNPTLGFSQHASVKENIFLRGTAMGIRYRQLVTLAPQILEFAGLEDRIDYPLYSLSTGQRMRLGFSISTAIQPDILFMDEWLSTGDAGFVERARKRMKDRFEGSRIVVLASHSTSLLQNTCNKALVLDKGRMRFFGDIEQGLEVYRGVISNASADERATAAGDDPVLFGDMAGMVERVRVSRHALEVIGWAADEKGREPSVVCIEISGKKYLVEVFERVQRDDVCGYLGKTTGKYGFKVAVPVYRLDAADLVHRMRVSIGRNASRLGAPLPLLHESIVEWVDGLVSTPST